MKAYLNGQEIIINGLNEEAFSDITEDSILTIYLPQKKFDKLHKIFSENRLPKERMTWIEFGWNLENLILHITGVYDNGSSYGEDVTIDLNEKEESCIKKIIKGLEEKIA